MSGTGSQQGPESIEKLRLLESEYDLCLLREDDPIRRDELEEKRARVKAQIVEKLGRIEMRSAPEAGARIAAPSELFSEVVERLELFKRLVELAQNRDIVFAIGGVGSGLTTFHQQFLAYMDDKAAACPIEGVDFNRKKYTDMYNLRKKINDVLITNKAMHLGADKLDLKCLLASLAHSAYLALRDTDSGGQLDRILPTMHSDPARFLTYYFDHDQCMAEAEAGPIIEYFFSTLQRFAEATRTDSILVFMPWLKLAEFFQEGDSMDGELGGHLWEALGEFAARRLRSRNDYSRVCLIIASRYMPHGDFDLKKPLVLWSLWPIPPFTAVETRDLLGRIGQAFNSDEASNTLMKSTGGCPWLTRYALSYVKYLHQPEKEKEADPIATIERACKLAGEQMSEHRVDSPVSNFAHTYIESIRSTLERGLATDPWLVDAWAGHKRRIGVDIDQRVVAFIASGLVWLEGDIWNNSQKNFVFKTFPTVRFREPGTLARITYEVATSCKLPPATR